MSIGKKTCKTCQREFASERDYLEHTTRWRLCELGNLWFNCNCGSTLIVQKGKFDWYSPTLGMSDAAQGIFNRLANIETLPRIPATIMKIQVMLSDDSIDPGLIAKTLKSDPVTAAAVIKHADNLKSSRDFEAKPISTIEHAVVYIGRNSLRDIIMAAAISNMDLPNTGYNYDRHWQKAFTCGAVAEKLSKYFKGMQEFNDEIYLGASLANIGKLVANHCFPEEVRCMVEDIKNPRTTTTWSNAEQAVGIPDHETLGEIAAALWGLPTYVSDACRWHHTKIDTRARRPKAEIAAFANQVTHWLSGEPELIDDKLLDSYRDALKMNQGQFDELVESYLPLRERAIAV